MKTVLIVCIVLTYAAGENVLVIFPNEAKSHFYAFEPLFVELANRGHNIVVISLFKGKQNIKNYSDIYIAPEEEAEKIKHEILSLKDYDPSKLNSVIGLIKFFFGIVAGVDVVVLEKSIELLNDSYKFDLIITEIFNTDLFLGFAYKYNASIIALSSSSLMPWATDRFGIQHNSNLAGTKTFLQRLKDFMALNFFKIVYNLHIKRMDEFGRNYFGEDMPPLGELAKKTSLVLVNTHFSFNKPEPLTPQAVEVAGLHIKPLKPLPKDIEKFINESEHGVIYFSFGSLVQSSTMQETTLRAFCDIFSQLRQRVLWKWETKEMPGKPYNVKIVEWTPQRDVLAHPNIRMFISHGGLLGTIEAIHSGVPVLGIPFYGDQMQNIDNLVNLEVGIRLDYLNISKQAVSYAVNTLLDDKKYKENAQRLSEIFKDRPQTPLETAVYWTEYVLRHKGAHHLRSAAVHLPWYQYLLLDVIFVMLSLVIITVLVLYFSIKLMLRKICTSTKKYKTQ